MVSEHQALPWARWPLRWHAALVVMVCSIVGALAWAWSASVQKQQSQVKTQLDDIHHAIQGLPVAAPDRTQQLVAQLPAASAVDHVVRDMVAWAQTEGLQLGSLDVQATPATPQTIGYSTISVSVSGDYAKVKAWLAELMARYPSLVVQSLSLQPPVGGSTGPMQAQVVWWLYVRDSS